MEKIQQVIHSNVNAKFIDLSFCQINNLQDVIYSLIKLRDLKEIHLSFNRLDSLPRDLSNFNKLEILDIRFNTFTNLENLLQSLKTIPNLKELYLDCNDSETQIIKNKIENLEIINNTIFKEGVIPRLKTNILNEDTNKISRNLFKSNISQDLKENKKEIIGYKEKEIIRHVINDIGVIIKNDFYNKEIKNFDSDKFLDELWEIKSNLETKSFTNWNELLLKLESIIKFITTHLKILFSSIDDVSGKLFENYQKLNFSMFSSITSHKESIHNDEFTFKNPNYIAKFRPFDDREKLFHLKEYELSKEIDDLKNDNKKLIEILLKFNNTETNNIINKIMPKYYDNEINFNQKEFKFLVNENKKKDLQNIINPNDKLGNVLEKKYTPKIVKDTLINVLKNKNNNQLGKSETLEEYLYSYFNKTLGLKELVIESTAGIIRCIKENVNKDYKLVLWAKVLRNELDENFMIFLDRITNEVKEYVKYLSKHVSTEKKFKNRLIEILNFQNKNILLKNDCYKILDRFLKDFQNTSLKLNFNSYFNDNSIKNDNNKLCINYNKLIEFLIKQEYYKHIDYINPFIQNFKMVDINSNGILNKKEFFKFLEILMVQNLGIEVDEITKLFNFERNNNRITFSKMVELFSSVKSYNYPEKKLIECFKY